MTLHRIYVDATRRPVRDTDAILCDAAAAFDLLSHPHDPYFKADGTRLTEAGDEAFSEAGIPRPAASSLTCRGGVV